jgi:FG-GAP-like repeat
VNSLLASQTDSCNEWGVGRGLAVVLGAFALLSVPLAAASVPTPVFGGARTVASFNGDHRNDIFVADHGYGAEPFPGHPIALSTAQGRLVDASANLPPESGFSHSAAAADVNRDGSIDLYVGNLCCGDHTPPEILLNDGTGHFIRHLELLPPEILDTDHRTYTRSLLIDVNSDGAPPTSFSARPIRQPTRPSF